MRAQHGRAVGNRRGPGTAVQRRAETQAPTEEAAPQERVPTEDVKVFDLVKAPTRIRLSASLPPEMVNIAEGIIRKFHEMIPDWCDYICIRFDMNPTFIMSCTSNYKERWITFVIGGSFLSHDAEEREATFIHELTHGLLSPLHCWTEKILDMVPEAMMKHVGGLLNEMVESTTCDIAKAFHKLYIRFKHDEVARTPLAE